MDGGQRGVASSLTEAALRFEPVYRWSLRRRGARFPPRVPQATAMNRALQTSQEWRWARDAVVQAGLPPHPDAPKNWDAAAALDLVLRTTRPGAAVMDAGAERYSPLLEWLYLFGYRDLVALNLAFGSTGRRGPIQYVPGDCTRTNFPDARFEAITCLSVIEHGVDTDAFLRESQRLLKPGGHLVVSTDYWSEPLATDGLTAYGAPIKIFRPQEIRRLVGRAKELGLEPTSTPDLSTDERCVRWQRFGLEYTFLVLGFRKNG